MISFYLTKIIQMLLLPPGIFIVFIIIFKKKKNILIFIAIVLYLLSTKYIAFKLIAPLENPYINIKNKKLDIVLLLGGGYYAKSDNLSLAEDSFKRFIYALEISKNNNIPIIFDGSKEEAIELKKTVDELNKNLNLRILILNNKYKRTFGIYIQNKALTTIDNAKNIKQFLKNNNLNNAKIALVTSAYHMRRSLDEFARVKIYPIAMATDFKISQDNQFVYFLPTPDGLLISFKALHEYLGLLRNKFR